MNDISAAAARTGLDILIAEDDADNALSMAMLLRLDGHEVKIARNGVDALEQVRTDKPDVLLLDLGLPGINGYEVAKQIVRGRPRKTPLVVAVTGFGQEMDRRRSADAGTDLHLVKPVEPAILQGLLKRFQWAQFVLQVE